MDIKTAKSFRDLEVWQKCHQLVVDIYELTGTFPDFEKFGLSSQMRRTAVSIAANIAEGFAKRGKRDKINYYNISQGALEELKYYLLLAGDLKYCGSTIELLEKAEKIGMMLNALISSIMRRGT